MVTFTIIYLMVGLYFLFLVYCYIEDENINKFDILNSLKPQVSKYLYDYEGAYISFIILSAVGICIAWPYVLYVIYKNNQNGYL